MGNGNFFSQFGEYVFIVIALYCIIRGIMVLKTERLPAGEKRWTNGFSENGLKKYAKYSSVIDILSGLVCIAVCIVKIMNLIDTGLFRIIILIVCAILLIGIIAVYQTCKKIR